MTTDAADLFDQKQQGVLVAVEADFADLLPMTRFLTLAPQLAA